jgi:hypothetical protein
MNQLNSVLFEGRASDVTPYNGDRFEKVFFLYCRRLENGHQTDVCMPVVLSDTTTRAVSAISPGQQLRVMGRIVEVDSIGFDHDSYPVAIFAEAVEMRPGADND